MESVSTQVFHSIHSYWRRRTYRRLDATKRQAKAIRLGGGGGIRTSSWRCRKAKVVWRTLRLRPKVWSAPLRLLGWVRNAYVDAMLALAGGQGRPSALWGRRMPRARQASVGSADFERRMMMHLLHSIVEPELPPRE
ncbi:hypothetical protein OPV22_018947 [Ensete ventricosum]|uniref:Uncharacterized protein n=1 Tax=Ensete ventricosum TaxID=4639 RepID=A0AAV8R4G2_ENSVE|nr:hypothetical protein OPV22_018947 [Ensete ventricosum]RWV78607.1 hypothetical protein GW17_00060398 [Ensete ventricosum]